jgi:integrase
MKLLKSSPKPGKRTRQRARKGEGSLKLRGSIYWYVIPGPTPGTKIERSCETSDQRTALLVKAQALVDSGKVKPGTPAPVLVGTILDGYEEYCEREKPRSWPALKSAIKHLRQAFGGVLASDLTTTMTDQFRRDRMKNDGVLDPTVNRELGYFRSALRREMKTTPPRVTFIPFMHNPSEKDRVREGFISREQYKSILGELPESLRAIFVCAFHTGARVGELRKVQWSQVNFAQGLIELRPKTTKNRDGRWIPIWGDMHGYLARQKEIHDAQRPGCPWVFFWMEDHHHRAVPGEPLKDFRFCWDLAVAAAGYPDLLFHDLRRSAIRYAEQEAGMSSIRVRAMSGHKTDAVYTRYNIVGGRDIQSLGRDLDAHLAASAKKVVPIRRRA